MKSETIVVSLSGGPGTGKSTSAADIFAQLKWAGVNAELVPEFPKELVWEERMKTLQDQVYVFGKQLHRLNRLIGKVDVIVTDAPIINSIVYKPDHLSDTFTKLVLEMNDLFNNKHYFLIRKKGYNPKGRYQTEDGAKEIDNITRDLLDRYKIEYTVKEGTPEGVQEIVKEILEILNNK